MPSRAELEHALAGRGFQTGPARVREQRDVYFDDPRGRLSAAGMALRLRRVGGRRFATLKSAGTVDGALHRRDEVDVELTDADDPATGEASTTAPRWPAAIVARLAPLVDVAVLVPVARLATTRVAYVLRTPQRGEVEVAFDEVRCRLSPDDGAPAAQDGAPAGAADARFSPEVSFHEVEIEAGAGASDADLVIIADALDGVVALTPSSVTKLERALALLAPFADDPTDRP